MVFCTRNIQNLLTSVLLLFLFGTSLSAQNGLFDVRFTVKNFDCANNKVTMQLQVKAHDAAHTFFMGDANYRFDYDPRVIRNPTIVSQENFSSIPPASDANYILQNLNGSSFGPTLGTVSLNTIYAGGGLGAKKVNDAWMTVSCIRFDVQDPTKCFDLIWHNDTRFPVTGMNEVALTSPTPDGNYDAYLVGAGGVFDNYSACIPNTCSGITAVDDINVTKINTAVSGTAATNDVSNGGAMTFVALGAGSNGTWVLNPNGSYTYTPTTGFTGKASQKYQVCNAAGQCDTAVIYITVVDNPGSSNANIAPVALNDNAQTTVDRPVTGNVLTNDFDPDGNVITLTTTPLSNPTNGTVVLSPTGAFLYTPKSGFVGQDTFKYKICDNGTPSKCDTAQVVITVGIDNNGTANDKPNAQDDAGSGYKGSPITGNLASNDSDPNGNVLTYNTTPLSNPTNGTVTISPTGVYTYTPTNPNFTGPDQFKYVVCDNGIPSLCDTATVYLLVLPRPNDPPVVSETPKTTPEDSVKTICVTYTDANTGDTHTPTLCGTKVGTASAPTASNGQLCFTYTPAPNYNGQDTVCIILCDQAGACDTAKIPITVTPVNDPPKIVDLLPPTMPEDSTITVCSTITDPDTPNGPFTVSNCSTPSGGTVTPSVVGNQLCITYKPDPNFNGKDTICVTVCDNTGLCDTLRHIITVTPVNDKPVVSKTPVTTPEDKPIIICQTITDPDAGNTFTATTCGVLHGTLGSPVVTGNQVCMTYLPSPNYNGPDTVCVIVCDNTGLCDTARIPIVVTPVNDKPVVVIPVVTVPEDSIKTICTTINDPDLGNTFTATPCGALHGTLGSPIVTGNQLCFTYLPTANYNGPDTICIIVCDNTGLCDTAKIPVVVTPVNDKPVVSKTPVTTPEDKPVIICQTITDPDVGNTFTATTCGVQHGTLGSPVITGNQVCMTYLPSPNYTGPDTVCVIVCDNTGLCDTARIPIVVTPVNDKPVVVIPVVTVPEDSIKTICTTINDPDAGNTFTATPCGALHGTLGSPIVTGNQLCFTYLPAANYNGLDTICMIVCDNTGLCDTAKIPVVVTPVNDKPVVTKTPVTTLEDKPVVICQTITDPDVGDTFSATLCAAPAHGTAGSPVVTGNQVCVTYLPTANYNGPDTLCLIVCDQAGKCDTAKIPITVTPVADPPVIVDVLPPTIPEDSTITVCSTILDPDTPNGPFTLFNCSTPAGGTVTPSVVGNQLCVTYKPVPNFTGKDTICLTICDNTGLCDTLRHVITVTPVNDPPVVRDTTVTAAPGAPNTICLPIADPDLTDTHLAFACGNPAHGTMSVLVVNKQLCITYTPTSTYIGKDSICLLVCDSGTPTLCDTVKVIYNVFSSNLPPVAMNDINTTLQGMTATGNVLTNDSDPNAGQTLTTSVLTNPRNSTAFTMNPNGTYSYTPVAGFLGTDTVVYKVCDNGIPVLCDTAILVIEIRPITPTGNQRPVANDDNTSTPSGQPITVNVKSNDTDPNPTDVLSKPTIVAQPACGSAVVNTNGTITFTPASGFIGTCDVKYFICDNGTPSLCDTATLSVNVFANPMVNNQAPDAIDDATTTPLNTPVTGTAATNDSDPDAGQTLSFQGITTPLHGGVTMLPNGTYTFTPTTGFVGKDSFRYKVCDNGTPSLCDTATVYIDITTPIVTPTNAAPIANPDNPVTTKGVAITIPVKSNDFDPNGDPLSNPTIVSAPTCGTATVNADGSIGFVPNAGFTGTCTLIYRVCDTGTPSLCDTALVTIKVNPTPVPANRPPVAIDDAVIGTFNQPLFNISLAANDSDPDAGQTLSFTQLTLPTHGLVSFNSATGTYTYFPLANFIGVDSFQYKVCDNGTPSLCDTAWAYITYINAPTTNVPPIAGDDAPETSVNTPVVINVLANDNDPNGTPLSNPTILTQPSCGTASVNANGTITFVPTTGFTGTCSFTYKVCDNGTPSLCDTATVTVKVNPVTLGNQPPVAQNDATTTPINTPVTSTVALNDSDPDAGQTLTFTKTSNPPNGIVVMQTNGTFLYTPMPGFVGRDSFPYSVCDNGTPVLCATAYAYIDVTAAGVNTNVPPVATDDKTSVVSGVLVNIPVKANDYDLNPNQTLGKPTIVSPPSCGTASVNADGTIAFKSNTGFLGVCTMSYSVCDNGSPSLCDTAVVTITVVNPPSNNNTNLAPNAIDDANSNYKNVTQRGNVGDNDTDPNTNQTLLFSTVTQPTHGIVTLNPNGTYSYVPTANYIGTDNFTYKVCDNGSPSMCDTATVYLTIYETPCVTFTLKVLLEGPYKPSTGRMSTTLNQRGLLPGQTPIGQFAVATAAGQPYKGAPWNYAGTEGDTIHSYPATVVDWVLVSLRTSPSSLVPVFRCAGWLHEDGTITFPKGCIQLPNGNYFILIEHRNHMGVMSPTAVPIVGNTLSFDFTSGDSYIVTNPPSFGAKALANGKWVMYGGDGRKDSQVSNFDINFNDSQLWKGESGIFDQYRLGDFNLDADVNFSDQVLWKFNSGKYSGVPH
jgi:large repetitive protein